MYGAVLFDLDGTLVDSVALIEASFNHATRAVLDYELSPQQARELMVLPLEDQMRALCEDRWQELFAAYVDYTNRWHEQMVRTFEGIPECLASLRKAGRLLAVVTSKRGDMAAVALRQLHLEGLFHEIVAYEHCGKQKPYPEPILTCLELLETSPHEALFVGDTLADIAAGKAAGVDTAAVGWGFYDLSELASGEPSYLLKSPAELLRLVCHEM